MSRAASEVTAALDKKQSKQAELSHRSNEGEVVLPLKPPSGIWTTSNTVRE